VGALDYLLPHGATSDEVRPTVLFGIISDNFGGR